MTSITSHMPACSSGWPGNVGLVLHFLFGLGLSSFFFSFLAFCDLRWWFVYLCIAMQRVGSQFPEPLALETQGINPWTTREVPRLSSSRWEGSWVSPGHQSFCCRVFLDTNRSKFLPCLYFSCQELPESEFISSVHLCAYKLSRSLFMNM